MKSDININYIEKYQKDVLKYIKKYLSGTKDNINISKAFSVILIGMRLILKIKDKIKSNKIKFFLCVVKTLSE